MKTLFSIFVPVLFIGFFIIPALPLSQSMQKSESTYPAEVKKVIDGKCYGCHSEKGKSQDAKDALLWDSLLNLPKSSQIATLDEIIKVLNENKMPPEGAVKKNPEMKMSPDEIRILKLWAESRADNMMK